MQCIHGRVIKPFGKMTKDAKEPDRYYHEDDSSMCRPSRKDKR